MSTPVEPTSRQVQIRLAAGFVAFAAGIGAVVTVVLLAHSILGTADSSSTSSSAAGASQSGSTTTSSSFPSPPPGALVLAHEDRDLAVGLSAKPSSGRLALQASVIGQEGPTDDLQVSFRVRSSGSSATGPAAPCGSGCYGTTVALEGKPASVDVSVRGANRAPSTVSFVLPQAWPPRSAARIVSRAASAWRNLRSLVVHDRLSSGPGARLTTVWRMVAPDRLTYDIAGGGKAVVIGAKRWDKEPGGRWQTSTQQPIAEPVPFWEAVANARLLGSGTIRGTPAWRLSFFDPQLRAWFELWVDSRTFRTLELRMTAQAHFMHQIYSGFDRPLAIVPPVGARS